MKTVIFFNTLIKLKSYDFSVLDLQNVILIAFVKADEYKDVVNNFSTRFSQIIPISCEDSTLNYQQSKHALDDIVSAIADKNSIHLISLSEENMLLVAKLREDFAIPGMSMQQTEKFRDKIKMKNALQASGVNLPTYQEMDCMKASDLEKYYQEVVDALGTKFVIKPKALLCAMGVSIIKNYAEFVHAMEQISDYHNYELETFISGTLYHIDSIQINGESIFQVCCEYSCPNFDFQLGIPLLSLPLPEDHSIVKQAKTLAAKVLNALDYHNGPSHLEFFVDANKKLVFLEIAARTPGAIVTPMYNRMFNFNMLNADLCFRLGLPIAKPMAPKKHYFSGLFPISEGKVVKLLEPTLSGQYELDWKVEVDAQLERCNSLRDIAASIIVANDNFAAAYADFKKLSKTTLLEIA